MNVIELRDNIAYLHELADRAQILLGDIVLDYLCPLNAIKGKLSEQALMAGAILRAEGHRATAKADMVDSILSEIFDMTATMENETKPGTVKPFTCAHTGKTLVCPYGYCLHALMPERSCPILKAVNDFDAKAEKCKDQPHAEQADAILADINKAVRRIETRPDWVNRMETLHITAIMLAMGWDDVSATGTPPPKEE